MAPIEIERWRYRQVPSNLDIEDTVKVSSTPAEVDQSYILGDTEVTIKSPNKLTYVNGTTGTLTGNEINQAKIGTGWPRIPQRPGDTITTLSYRP